MLAAYCGLHFNTKSAALLAASLLEKCASPATSSKTGVAKNVHVKILYGFLIP